MRTSGGGVGSRGIGSRLATLIGAPAAWGGNPGGGGGGVEPVALELAAPVGCGGVTAALA